MARYVVEDRGDSPFVAELCAERVYGGNRWYRVLGRQCLRRHLEGSDYCKTHQPVAEARS